MANGQDMTSRVGFVGLLQILFIALKLTKVLSWSWFWVLSPTIFEMGLIAIVFTLYIVYHVVTTK